MDWQQILSLFIVAITAGLFLKIKLARRPFSFQRDTHCGCAAAAPASQRGSIVFRARKGQRPEVVVRMR